MGLSPIAPLDSSPFETWLNLQRHLHDLGLAPGDPSLQGIEVARARHEAYLLALSAREQLDGRERIVTIQAGPQPRRLLLVEPQQRSSSSCGILYLRGAGWWGGSLASSRPVVHRLARETGMAVCAVDYRRIPEHPFPSQREDVLAALSWLTSLADPHLSAPKRWILWGESAGASLAVCAAAKAALIADLAPLAGMVLLYGNHAGPQIHSERSCWIWEHYLAALRQDEYREAIPTLQTPNGLPRAFLAVGLDDPLLNDSRRFHHHLLSEGLSSKLIEFAGLPHSFAAMAAMLKPAQAAFSECAAEACSMASEDL